MRAPFLFALVLLGSAPAWAAEEPSGCDKFKWNIDHERAALTAPDRVKLASGAVSAARSCSIGHLNLSQPLGSSAAHAGAVPSKTKARSRGARIINPPRS